MLGMPAEAFNDVAVAIFHIPPIGPMRATDLAYYNHDALLVMAPFPLEQGKGWTFEWREEETHGKVVEVIVPDDPHLAIIEQQLAGVAGSPRSVDVEVGPARDTMGLAIALGEVADPPGTGAYRAAATAPDGTTYEHTLGPTDGEPAVQHGVHVENPGGIWSMELETIGTGGALIEAIAYNETRYGLGPSNG